MKKELNDLKNDFLGRQKLRKRLSGKVDRKLSLAYVFYPERRKMDMSNLATLYEQDVGCYLGRAVENLAPFPTTYVNEPPFQLRMSISSDEVSKKLSKVLDFADIAVNSYENSTKLRWKLKEPTLNLVSLIDQFGNDFINKLGQIRYSSNGSYHPIDKNVSVFGIARGKFERLVPVIESYKLERIVSVQDQKIKEYKQN
ncbi:MAG: hypothetical protein AABW50_03845 [Nanoarchaeota archaeon]